MKAMSPERRDFLWGPWTGSAVNPIHRRSWLKHRWFARWMAVCIAVGGCVILYLARLAPSILTP
jgi:hypothetical protein